MALAISSGVPNLPSGTMLVVLFRRVIATPIDSASRRWMGKLPDGAEELKAAVGDARDAAQEAGVGVTLPDHVYRST